MNLARLVAVIFLVLGGAAALAVLQVGSGISFSKNGIDPSAFVGIILTALAVILAALALAIGALAIIGWATFSRQVDRNVKSYIERDFDEKGPLFTSVIEDLIPKLREELIPILEKEMYKGTQADYDDLEDLGSYSSENEDE